MLANMADSRELRETVVRALAKVGLVWALFVLGALFMAMSSVGNEPGGYALEAVGSTPPSATFTLESGQAPSTEGLALALFVLAGGVMVLAVGGIREPRGFERSAARPADSTMDLPLALGLCFGSADPA